MGAFKASGPDGLIAHFYQSHQNIIGNKFCMFIKDLFANPTKIVDINQTSIA